MASEAKLRRSEQAGIFKKNIFKVDAGKKDQDQDESDYFKDYEDLEEYQLFQTEKSIQKKQTDTLLKHRQKNLLGLLTNGDFSKNTRYKERPASSIMCPQK